MKHSTGFVSRLETYPRLKARMEKILAIAENKDGKLVLADDVEERVDEEIRALAREVMQGWAEAEDVKQSTALRQNHKVTSDGKKNSAGTPSTAR